MFALCLEKINIEIQSLCPTLFLTFLPVISKSGTIGKTPFEV
jgi:hypothetical protein